MVKKSDVDKVLIKIDTEKSGELNYDQFKEAMDMIEVLIDDDEDDDENIIEVAPAMKTTATAGKGFSSKGSEQLPTAPKTSATSPKNPTKMSSETGADTEAEAITREMFDELRAKRKTVSVVNIFQ